MTAAAHKHAACDLLRHNCLHTLAQSLTSHDARSACVGAAAVGLGNAGAAAGAAAARLALTACTQQQQQQHAA